MIYVNDPFSQSYAIQLKPFTFKVDYAAKGECGMGGPTQGVLTIPGVGKYEQALPCIIASEDACKLAFMTWFRDDGNAKIKVHVLNIENKHIQTSIIEFGAYRFTILTANQLKLKDIFSSRNETIKL